MPRRVLIVSYSFPPYNVISALRAGKLAKYLPQFGWEAWVLTLEEGMFPSAGRLPVELPSERIVRADLGRLASRIARGRNGEPSGFPRTGGERKRPARKPGAFARVKALLWSRLSGLFTESRIPDRALPWFLPALARGTALLGERRFDAILSTFGPPTSHLVASRLARRFDLPWIADYRDLWTQNHVVRRSGLIQWLETRYEKWVMSAASVMTTVSSPLAGQLRALHGKPVTVLPNGFDEEDFEAFSTEPPAESADKFVIVYTGMIYPGKRDPSIVFQAARALIDAGVPGADGLEFHFYGSDAALLQVLGRKHGVEANLRVFPRIPNREAVARQIQADALLVLEWTDPSAQGVFTGKVFEYLGARRPVLATGADGGVIQQLLEETASGFLVRDAVDASARIGEWLRIKREQGTTRLPPDARILPYTRRQQARQLAELLASVAAERENSRELRDVRCD